MNSKRLELGVESLRRGTDWFTENPPLQPKAEIADYIESENIAGLKFPERYSIAEGIVLSRSKPIIFRTEHPNEYTGRSGVGESVIFGPSDNLEDETDLFNRLAKRNEDIGTLMPEHTNTLYPLTYSAWEVIPGINKTIYKDDTVANKFHIFLRWQDSEAQDSCAHYMQIEDNEVVFSSGDDISQSTVVNNVSLTEIYNDICSLKKFTDSHSAIMEFQESDSDSTPGQHYFLQVHRGREQTQINFELDETPEGYYEIKNVRGATSANGINVVMNLATMPGKKSEQIEPRTSFYGIDYFQHNQDPREAVVVITKTTLNAIASNHAYSHFDVDVLAKPQIVLFPESKLNFLSQLMTPKIEGIIHDYEYRYTESRKGSLSLIDYSTNLHVISDGKKAFISKPTVLIVRFFDIINDTIITLEVNHNGNFLEK